MNLYDVSAHLYLAYQPVETLIEIIMECDVKGVSRLLSTCKALATMAKTVSLLRRFFGAITGMGNESTAGKLLLKCAQAVFF